MGNKNATPIKMHLLKGNPNHLTKEQIQDRLEAEIKIGNHDFKIPPEVRRNSIAKKKWKELIALYISNDIGFVSTSDTGLISRYCLTFAEYLELQKVRDDIVAKGWDRIETYSAINNLGVDEKINKKLDLLLKMDAHLFLTPVSKIKNVPKKEKKKADPLAQAGFGNV
jgi:phage terminase small subunit